MKKLLFLCLAISLSTMALAADDDNDSKAVDRIKAAGEVLDQIEGAPDQGIPEEVLGSAECVAVVPSMLKGGFIVGARYGAAWPAAVRPRAGARRRSSPSKAAVLACRLADRRSIWSC